MTDFLYYSSLVVLIIGAIITIFMSEDDDDGLAYHGWPTTYVVIAIFLLFVFHYEVIETVRSFDRGTWQLIIGGAFAYLVLGILWSFFRFNKLVKKKLADYRDALEDYRKNSINNGGYSYSGHLPDINRYKPEVSRHKSALAAWIVWWPFTTLRYLVGRFIFDFINWIIDRCSAIYNRIINSKFQDIEVEYNEEVERLAKLTKDKIVRRS